MNWLHHLLISLCVLTLGLAITVGNAFAQQPEEPAPPAPVVDDEGPVGVGLILGLDLGIEDGQDMEFIGGLDARFYIEADESIDVVINPAAVIYPFLDAEGVNLIQIDLNILAQFDVDAPVEPYVGPGVALNLTLIDDFDNQTDFGINGVAGVAIDLDAQIEPFVQARFTRVLADEGFNILAVMAGANFRF